MAENHDQVSRTAMMLSVKVTSDSKMTDCAPWRAIAPCYRDAIHDTAAAGHKGRGYRGWVGCVLIAESTKATSVRNQLDHKNKSAVPRSAEGD